MVAIKITKSTKKTKGRTKNTRSVKLSKNSSNTKLANERAKNRNATLTNYSKERTKRVQSRHNRDKATAKYKAAERSALYGSMSTAASVEDVSESNAEMAKAMQQNVIINNNGVNITPDTSVKDTDAADVLIDTTVPTTPGSNPSIAAPGDGDIDRGKFATSVYT